MADLLLKEKLLKTLHNPDSEIFIIGRSKTVTVLQSLDPARQHLVIQFLKSANLNGAEKYSSIRVFEFLYLKGFLKKGLLYQAQMSNANLSNADLSGVNFRRANLSNADLSNSDLSDADLSETDLSNPQITNLIHLFNEASNVQFSNAQILLDYRGESLRLIGANLRGSKLNNANLRRSNLSSADLSNSDLSNANLSEANLSNTDLRGAILSIKQIKGSCHWENAQFSDDIRKQLEIAMPISTKPDQTCEYLWSSY
jgi:uncharacterized protein YjbI with pentapeptide repeats